MSKVQAYEDGVPRAWVDPGFVMLPKYGYSTDRLCERFPDGVPAELEAQALCMTMEEVEKIFQETIATLRRGLKV